MKQDIDKGPESVTDGNQSTVNSDSRPGCPSTWDSLEKAVHLPYQGPYFYGCEDMEDARKMLPCKDRRISPPDFF